MLVAWSQVGLAGVLGGLLALERRAFLQAMFSRPIVAATLTGLLLDDVPSGLFVGMLLELFHLGQASLGAAIPENETLAATGTAAAAAAMAHGSGGGGTPAIWSISILLFGWLGFAGRRAERWLERYSTRLATRAEASTQAGDIPRAMRQNLWGMWPHFALFGAATAGCALAGYACAPLLGVLSLRVLRGLAWAYPSMASVAAAVAVRGSHARRAPAYAVGAAMLVCAWVILIQSRTP